MKKSKYKNLFTKLSLILVSLIMLFVVLELCARLFNVPSASYDFFELDYQNNRYLTPTGQSFLKNKENNTFRIFVFGGSSIDALGDFELLRELLDKKFPSTYFEIINVGRPSYGTNRLVPILKEAAECNPDLFIIYSGHNEFLEEFLQENFCFNLVQRLDKTLSSFRGYAFLCKTLNRFMAMLDMEEIEFLRDEVRIIWGIPLPDKKRNLIYRRYESNIYEMVNFAKAKGIEMIISTVAYNYLDDRYVSPLYYSSRHDTTHHSESQIAIESIPDEKVLELDDVLQKDPYIENRLGKYYLKKQDYDKAIKYFISAAEVDFRPFRASVITNSIVRKISNDFNILIADVERVIIQHSNHMIPDFKLFDDWCHLNREGRRLVQIVFFNAIEKSNKLKNPYD